MQTSKSFCIRASGLVHRRCFIFLVLLCSASSVFAQTDIRRYTVAENGKPVAKAVVESSGKIVKVTVHRAKRPAHIYRTAIWAGVTTLHIGQKRVLEYQNDTQKVKLADASFIATHGKPDERRSRPEVIALQQSASEDMKLLRAIRGADPSSDVNLAELALVIATGDDSWYAGDAPRGLKVTKESSASRNKRSGKRKTD